MNLDPSQTLMTKLELVPGTWIMSQVSHKIDTRNNLQLKTLRQSSELLKLNQLKKKNYLLNQLKKKNYLLNQLKKLKYLVNKLKKIIYLPQTSLAQSKLSNLSKNQRLQLSKLQGRPSRKWSKRSLQKRGHSAIWQWFRRLKKLKSSQTKKTKFLRTLKLMSKKKFQYWINLRA